MEDSKTDLSRASKEDVGNRVESSGLKTLNMKPLEERTLGCQLKDRGYGDTKTSEGETKRGVGHWMIRMTPEYSKSGLKKLYNVKTIQTKET